MKEISRDLKDWKHDPIKDIYKFEVNDSCWLEFYYNYTSSEDYTIELWSDWCDTPDVWFDNVRNLDDGIDRINNYLKALDHIMEDING